VDALRCDNEDGVFFDVGERVDFVALVYAEGAAAEEEEGDVGAEQGGDFDEALERETFARELEITKEGGCGVAGTASEPATGGDFLVEVDLNAGADFQFAAKRIDRAKNEIFLEWFLREAIIAVNGERDSGMARGAETQIVVKRNGLKDCAQFVIVVGAFADNVESQIDFRERWNSDFAHGEIVYT